VYVMEGAIFVTGAAIQWLRDGIGMIEDPAETGPLAASVADSGGVVFVPAFTGLGSPWWDSYARGSVFGLPRGSGRAPGARAVVGAVGGGARRGRGRRDHGWGGDEDKGAARRRWRQRDGRALPVPSRRPRCQRAAPDCEGNDRAGRRAPCRPGRGSV